MVICPRCAEENPGDSGYCHSCGAPLAPSAGSPPSGPRGHRLCPRCGTDNPPDHAFCQECGTALESDAEAFPPDQGIPPILPPTRPFQGGACPRCGTLNLSGNAFCTGCGAILPPDEAPARGEDGKVGDALRPVSPGFSILPFFRDDQPTLGGFQVAEPPPNASPEPGRGRLDSRDIQQTPLTLRSGPGFEAGKTRRLVAPEPPAAPALLLLREDGTVTVFPIGPGLTIGRETGDIVIAEDPFLSGRHACVVREGEEYLLQDLGSTNGTFILIEGPVVLGAGDLVLIGGELFRLELRPTGQGGFPAAPSWPEARPHRSLAPRFLRIGEDGEEQEEVLPGDPRLEGIHVDPVPPSPPLAGEPCACVLTRSRSAPDTYTRLRDPLPLKDGDTFLTGKQLFKFERSRVLR